MSVGPAHLLEALSAELGEGSALAGSLVDLLIRERCSTEIVAALAGIARSPAVAWSARRVAVLILEHHLHRAPPATAEDVEAAERRVELGEAGRRRAVETFDRAPWVRRYVETIERLVS